MHVHLSGLRGDVGGDVGRCVVMITASETSAGQEQAQQKDTINIRAHGF